VVSSVVIASGKHKTHHSYPVSPEEIVKITASNALFYHFATPGTAMKGPEDAYQQILKDGCSQITQVWVNNHWSLILWKLAGIVKAKPALWEARWTFAEVVRQLKYRYVTLDSISLFSLCSRCRLTGMSAK